MRVAPRARRATWSGRGAITTTVLLLAACNSDGPSQRTSPPDPSRPQPPLTTTRWRAHTVGAHGVTIDLVDGIAPALGELGTQHFIVQRLEVGVASLRVGPDLTLAWWRTSLGGRALAFGVETTTTVCGRTGSRQEVVVPEEVATGLVSEADGSLGHLHHRTPAQVHVAIAGTTTAGTAFVVTWVVDADRRGAARADEAHFLESIRCE